jgi:hypothetical protein
MWLLCETRLIPSAQRIVPRLTRWQQELVPTYNGSGYSPLYQITVGNVQRLRPTRLRQTIRFHFKLAAAKLLLSHLELSRRSVAISEAVMG